MHRPIYAAARLRTDASGGPKSCLSARKPRSYDARSRARPTRLTGASTSRHSGLASPSSATHGDASFRTGTSRPPPPSLAGNRAASHRHHLRRDDRRLDGRRRPRITRRRSSRLTPAPGAARIAHRRLVPHAVRSLTPRSTYGAFLRHGVILTALVIARDRSAFPPRSRRSLWRRPVRLDPSPSPGFSSPERRSGGPFEHSAPAAPSTRASRSRRATALLRARLTTTREVAGSQTRPATSRALLRCLHGCVYPPHPARR